MKICILLFCAAVFSTESSSEDYKKVFANDFEQDEVKNVAIPQKRRRLSRSMLGFFRGFGLSLAGLLVFAFAVILALLYSREFQSALIFLNFDTRPWIDWARPEIAFQSKLPQRLSSHAGIQNVEVVRTITRNLFGWFMPGVAATSATKNWNKYNVLYFHGNSGHIGRYYRVFAYKLLNRLGMNVFAFEYTGFGQNAGKPSQKALGKDGADMFKTTLLKTKPTEKIILWGHSLGTGAIFQTLHLLGSEQLSKIHAVILEAPFLSILDVVHDNYLPKILQGPKAREFLSKHLKDHFNSYEVAKSFNKLPFPILILHSTRDGDIPVEHGRKMHQALQQRTPAATTFKEIDSGTHNEITMRADFTDTLTAFLNDLEK